MGSAGDCSFLVCFLRWFVAAFLQLRQTRKVKISSPDVTRFAVSDASQGKFHQKTVKGCSFSPSSLHLCVLEPRLQSFPSVSPSVCVSACVCVDLVKCGSDIKMYEQGAESMMKCWDTRRRECKNNWRSGSDRNLSPRRRAATPLVQEANRKEVGEGEEKKEERFLLPGWSAEHPSRLTERHAYLRRGGGFPGTTVIIIWFSLFVSAEQ